MIRLEKSRKGGGKPANSDQNKKGGVSRQGIDSSPGTKEGMNLRGALASYRKRGVPGLVPCAGKKPGRSGGDRGKEGGGRGAPSVGR